MNAPVATTRIMKGLQGSKDQSLILRRREYVGDIAGSTTFANTAYNCNPGLANLFPWTSQIANSYDEYVVTSMQFIYEPEQASSATGAVILSFDYDASDPAPVDKTAALLTKDSVRAAPWVPCCLELSAPDLRKRCADALFTRAGTVTSTDIKMYDLGILNVSTVGQAGTTTVGELWVDFTMQLRVPQKGSSPGEQLTITGVSKTAPFTGTQVVTGSSIVATATGAILTFQVAGYYLITHAVVGTTLTAIATPTASTGASVADLGIFIVNAGATFATKTVQARVLAGSTLTFDDATGNTTVTSTTTYIAPWFTV